MTLPLADGQWGEDLAADYLSHLGMKILARNWRNKRAEIDIIGEDGPVIVFIEVKARSNLSFGPPEEMVSYRKKKLLFHAASAYMLETGHEGEIRFDILAITHEPHKMVEIRHFKDAFYPGSS
jgi:putative endonuclease